jgi:hypothetical protein
VWTLVDGKPFCPEHQTSFGSTETCPRCPLPTQQALTDDPAPDDPQAREDEAWCRRQRDAVITMAEEMIGGREQREAIDRVGYSTVAKLYETALKFHRSAVEERHKRGDKEFEIWLVEQHRRLKEKAH